MSVEQRNWNKVPQQSSSLYNIHISLASSQHFPSLYHICQSAHWPWIYASCAMKAGGVPSLSSGNLIWVYCIPGALKILQVVMFEIGSIVDFFQRGNTQGIFYFTVQDLIK